MSSETHVNIHVQCLSFFSTLLKKEKCQQILEKLSSIKVHKICSAVLELLHAERRQRERERGREREGQRVVEKCEYSKDL